MASRIVSQRLSLRSEQSFTRSLLRPAIIQPWTSPYTQKRFDSSNPANRPQIPPYQADAIDISEKAPSTAAYRPFVRPFAKVFLGAMLTYQILYWCWEKLRLDEIKEEKLGEISELEAQVEEYRQRKAAGLAADGSHTLEGASAGGSSIFSTIKSWF